MQWCDFTTHNLQRFVAPMKIEDESEWQAWGANAVQLLRAAKVEGPNPYTFPDFLSWAVKFNQEIQDL